MYEFSATKQFANFRDLDEFEKEDNVQTLYILLWSLYYIYLSVRAIEIIFIRGMAYTVWVCVWKLFNNDVHTNIKKQVRSVST